MRAPLTARHPRVGPLLSRAIGEASSIGAVRLHGEPAAALGAHPAPTRVPAFAERPATPSRSTGGKYHWLAPAWARCQRRGRDVATSKRVISTLRGTGLESTLRAALCCSARCCCRWSIDSHRSDRTARSGSRGSAAITYSRQPSSSREDRIAAMLVSTNRSRSFGSTENTPCTITMAMRFL
jgi:hypothetical protein